MVFVSALSGESILGPRPGNPRGWLRAGVSALSGESILGPRHLRAHLGTRPRVSALSGESILGPQLELRGNEAESFVFQHSLVSLFWGHRFLPTGSTAPAWFQHSLVSLFWGHNKNLTRPYRPQCFSTLW